MIGWGIFRKGTTPAPVIEREPVATIVASYQMFGDLKPETWANLVFLEAKLRGQITDWQYLKSTPLSFGIEDVMFSVTLPFENADIYVQEERALDLLNGIVGDSDVVILDIQRA